MAEEAGLITADDWMEKIKSGSDDAAWLEISMVYFINYLNIVFTN
jgi:hypothetical protein